MGQSPDSYCHEKAAFSGEGVVLRYRPGLNFFTEGTEKESENRTKVGHHECESLSLDQFRSNESDA